MFACVERTLIVRCNEGRDVGVYPGAGWLGSRLASLRWKAATPWRRETRTVGFWRFDPPIGRDWRLAAFDAGPIELVGCFDAGDGRASSTETSAASKVMVAEAGGHKPLRL